MTGLSCRTPIFYLELSNEFFTKQTITQIIYYNNCSNINSVLPMTGSIIQNHIFMLQKLVTASSCLIASIIVSLGYLYG